MMSSFDLFSLLGSTLRGFANLCCLALFFCFKAAFPGYLVLGCFADDDFETWSVLAAGNLA